MATTVSTARSKLGGISTLKATMATPAAIRAAVWPIPQNAPRRHERSSPRS